MWLESYYQKNIVKCLKTIYQDFMLVKYNKNSLWLLEVEGWSDWKVFKTFCLISPSEFRSVLFPVTCKKLKDRQCLLCVVVWYAKLFFN